MIAVFASGQGSNFEALAQHFPNQISALICNVSLAPVLKLAEKYHIPSYDVPHKNFSTRAEHERAIISILNELNNIEFIILAGYMRVLTAQFFQLWQNKTPIFNLHPAHLEEYKGAHAYEFAVKHKFPRWGLSFHEVTEKLDSGKLFSSTEFSLFPYESVEQVKARIKKLEHQFLINSVESLLNKRNPYL